MSIIIVDDEKEIVMTEYVDGKIKVNDPNSKARSDKLWNLSDIKSQIHNLWVCRVSYILK